MASAGVSLGSVFRCSAPSYLYFNMNICKVYWDFTFVFFSHNTVPKAGTAGSNSFVCMDSVFLCF